MEAQLKGTVLIALVVVTQWQCPILKTLSAKLPPKSETAPHQGWQDGTILGPGIRLVYAMQYLVRFPNLLLWTRLLQYHSMLYLHLCIASPFSNQKFFNWMLVKESLSPFCNFLSGVVAEVAAGRFCQRCVNNDTPSREGCFFQIQI